MQSAVNRKIGGSSPPTPAKIGRGMKLTHERMKKAGIFELWWNKNLKDFEGNEKVVKKVKKYLDKIIFCYKEGIGLILFSKIRGTGKTMLMMEVCKEYLRKDKGVQVCSLAALTDLFANGWTNADEKIRFKNRVKEIDVLAVDDLGKGLVGRANLAKIILDSILRYRVQRKKVTLLTTNLEPPELEKVFGEDLVSLISESCYAIKVEGRDFRRNTLYSKLRDKVEN